MRRLVVGAVGNFKCLAVHSECATWNGPPRSEEGWHKETQGKHIDACGNTSPKQHILVGYHVPYEVCCSMDYLRSGGNCDKSEVAEDIARGHPAPIDPPGRTDRPPPVVSPFRKY